MKSFGLGLGAMLVLVLAGLVSTVKIRIEPQGASAKAPPPLISLRRVAPSASPAATGGEAEPGPEPAPFASAPVVPAPPDASTTDAPLLVMPVEGADIAKVADSWGAARDGGARQHHGTDIMAPSGTAVLAAAPGTIEKLYFSKGGGGISIYQRSEDGRWEFYYAHLGGYAPGLTEGQRVTAGQPIAYVGDTGNAAPGVHHLHFGVSQMQPGEGWWQGTPIDPYPLLLAGAGQAR